MIPCPRNYGVKISTSFTKGTHDSRDVVTHGLTNKVLASDQLSWLVRRGDLLLESEEREIVQSLVGSFGDGHSRVFKLPIYEYLGDKAPDRYKISQEGQYARSLYVGGCC